MVKILYGNRMNTQRVYRTSVSSPKRKRAGPQKIASTSPQYKAGQTEIAHKTTKSDDTNATATWIYVPHGNMIPSPREGVSMFSYSPYQIGELQMHAGMVSIDSSTIPFRSYSHASTEKTMRKELGPDDIHRVNNWENRRSPLENLYLFGYVVMLVIMILAINVVCSLLPTIVSSLIQHTTQRIMDGNLLHTILHFFSFHTIRLMMNL